MQGDGWAMNERENRSFIRRKRHIFIIALLVISLLISVVLIPVVGVILAERLSPTAANFRNFLLFICQVVLLASVVCLLPTPTDSRQPGARTRGKSSERVIDRKVENVERRTREYAERRRAIERIADEPTQEVPTLLLPKIDA